MAVLEVAKEGSREEIVEEILAYGKKARTRPFSLLKRHAIHSCGTILILGNHCVKKSES